MNRDRELFAEAGARLVVVGQGTPSNAADFRERFHLDLDLLVDTDRRAYQAAGTKVGTLSELLRPRVVARGLRRARETRVLPGGIDGHPMQLGGLMLVTPGSKVPWAHLSDDASDYPANAEVVEVVRAALGPRDPRPAAG
ncbi:MAG: AhpC/TSA family protein [Actinomycetota bacterium]|nr:AhpC/TSA family protein [Actinomycetota bacterium]